MTNGFALNHDKSLQIYFVCVKRQRKKKKKKKKKKKYTQKKPDFLEEVERIVTVINIMLLSTLNNTQLTRRGQEKSLFPDSNVEE